ncbi:endonuclease MutS2 [Oribacterium sp. WCC10]|uniref:endonuclease MutS2 n=1 Tax=Oribacterium sp. WCC10 TaxID=1855343 RepID=UPI0008E8C40D|nr:endonuclease MutS2 [Oribacterium sp. WCC10]SFG15773.1 DNA mismatch repair protein MutS2 [Oribacterium sp. WCC10]
MNDKALNTLEFNKIKERLEGYANSQKGKQLVRELLPSSDLDEIQQSLAETDAAMLRIGLYGNLSFSGVKDVDGSLKRLDIAASLSIAELLQISGALTVAGRAKAYARDSEKSAEKKAPVPRAVRLNAHYTKNQPDPEKLKEQTEDDSLSGYFRDIEPLTQVNKEILRCILSEDTVADDASAGLLSVRKKKRTLEDRIHSSLNNILNSSRAMLQDAVITMRDGRYCLPVKSEYKSSFPGMVHDQSSTGSTLFIEPMSIVKLNNDIKELEAEEKKEIEKVLETLSGSLMPYTSVIHNDIEILAHLDFVFAKAKFAESIHATMPIFNDRYYISIIAGRHPLIDPKKVVPTTVYLGKDFDMLVITGPNTGGKTVCLKTIGLFQLMGQSGLFIPAAEGSELAVFEEIFADIGDEQSIEQSLSTFSAHMTNTVRILEKADSHSLCLFDELGAGTDPTEGAALAMAILNFLHNMKTRTVATTHYAEIKVYALSTPGVENASCEFDVTTLSPTYRLLIGVPGKSNAFAISSKLGLPSYIIDDARNRLEQEDVKFEDVITSLEESRVTIEREKQEIERYKAEIEEYKRRARENSRGVEKGRDKLLQKAREEAAQILSEAKETADSIVKELRKHEQNGSATLDAEKTRSTLNRKLRETQASLSGIQKQKGPAKPVSARNLHIGDIVHVASMNINATVSTLPDHKGELYVTAGIIRTKVSVRDIEFVESGKVTGPGIDIGSKQKKGSTSGGNIRMQKTLGISPEINLIGMTTSEAIPELQKYLDDAYLAHLPQARVVHGRGTGALRKAVHQQLKKLKYVDSFRLGEFGEGQDGVTIVFFKK